ncbi:hypothetical protein ASC82_13485 [Streptomyces sp. Root431]|uniref:hypothetical protein n=1 Tax=Streptomyces sp. Root431 TaxID=1736535 RepID=UPI0006F5D495|nr:hypothetical protein [Streptomyces sp. Root431]KQX12246.1 hypothetical protein ASC82_13485 [Streptomyces sp. Root431]
MSASEKSGQSQFPWTGPYAVPDYPDTAETYDSDTAERYDSDTAETYDPDTAEVYVDMGELHILPMPFPERARTAAQAARGAGNTLWTALRAHKAATAGAAAGTAAALTLAYALGRRARRRGPGPVALLFERRF